jgi:hypothetical protein
MWKMASKKHANITYEKWLSGWWYTYPSEKWVRQLGWWHSQYMDSYKFHGSNPPTRICISYLVSVSDTDLISLAHESWHPASSCQLKVAEYCYPHFLVIGDVSMSVDILTSVVQIFKACHCQWSPLKFETARKVESHFFQTTDDDAFLENST